MDKLKDATTTKRCTAKTKRGLPCKGWAVSGSDFCFVHDPSLAKERAAARSKGGRARHGRRIGQTGAGDPVILGDVGAVVRLLERVINDALSLENSLQRARTVGSLAGVVLKGLEVGELEDRVSALEQLGGAK